MSGDKQPVYFYGRDKQNGFLSQMHLCKFEDQGIVYRSSEHYFQAAKARLSNDTVYFNAIVSASSPYAAKRLGRKLKLDVNQWNQMSYQVAVDANYLKFTKSDSAIELRNLLLSTKGCDLYEASPTDKTWGIGCDERLARVTGHFPGKNLLGKALVEVRTILEEEEEQKALVHHMKEKVLGG